MKGCLSLILILCCLFAISETLDNFGFFNKNPEEVAKNIEQELSEALEKTTTEQEVIELFHRQSFDYIRDSENLFDIVKSSLNSPSHLTAEDFANDINKVQVLKSKLTVNINKLNESGLSNEEQYQELLKIFESESALTDSLSEAIQNKISGGNWHEPFAKAQMLKEELKLLPLPEEFATFTAEKYALYDKVEFFYRRSGYTRYVVAENLKIKTAQFNSAESPSETELSFDLQTLQILKERNEILQDQIAQTDFKYDSVKQKFFAAFDLETAMTDALAEEIYAKLYGEDWQPASLETQELIESFDAVKKELKEMGDNIKGGKNPEAQVEENPALVENQAQEGTLQGEKVKEEKPQSSEENLPESDKEAVRVYLEKTQPFSYS